MDVVYCAGTAFTGDGFADVPDTDLERLLAALAGQKHMPDGVTAVVMAVTVRPGERSAGVTIAVLLPDVGMARLLVVYDVLTARSPEPPELLAAVIRFVSDCLGRTQLHLF